MRSLFLALLLANLLLFSYLRFGGDQDESSGGADSGPPIARLLRLGEPGSAGPRCATIGPFGSQAGAQRAAASLLAARRGSRQRSSDASGPASYWVMIQTKTLQDATKIGSRLRAAGVTDLVITPPDVGATDAVVSLGVFSERDRAERRVQDLRRYAVTPAIVEQPHTVTSWWLEVDLAATDRTPDLATLARVAGESGSLRAAACAAPAAAPNDATPAKPAKPAGPGATTTNPPAPAPGAAKLPGAPA